MTLRANAVKEGKTAAQEVSRAVSHTTGLVMVLSNTPDEEHTKKSNLFTRMMKHDEINQSINKTDVFFIYIQQFLQKLMYKWPHSGDAGMSRSLPKKG